MKYAIGTQAEMAALAATVDATQGYPQRGVHVGSGIHVDLDGPERAGWTLHHADARKHPSKLLWAYPVADDAVGAKVLDKTWEAIALDP